MKDSEFRKKLDVIRASIGPLDLSDAAKKALGQSMKSVLRAIAKADGLQSGQYDVRYNPGGTAVKGDGVLHSDDLYVSVSPDCAGPGVLVRNCKGRKDYTGGANGWLPWKSFLEAGSPSELCQRIRGIAPRQAPSSLAKPAGLGVDSPPMGYPSHARGGV